MFISCGGSSKEKKTTGKEKKDSIVSKDTLVKANAKYNDIARYLGGLKLNEKSELTEATKSPAWLTYCKYSDSSWIKLERKRLKLMGEWSQKEIPDLYKDVKTLFYPFSGPDFVHVNALFPNAQKYILFGLEPIGTIPDFSKMKKEVLGPYFAYINKSLDDIISLSFFKTIDMSSDLNNAKVNGTLPLILLFMARTGHEIVDIKPVKIDTSGTFSYIPAFKGYKGESSYNYGAEVKFKDANDSTHYKTLYYFSANIIDKGVTDNKNLRLFLEKLDTGLVTFVKSASYLMHNTYFSAIRNAVLNKSKAILQDDSGISYKYYDKKIWNIGLYGKYTGPIDMFANRFEKDLKAAFDTEKPKPFSFKYGYGTNSNMLLARKK